MAISNSSSSSKRWLTAASLLTLYLAWGSIYLAIQVGLKSFPPLLFAGLQNAVGIVLYIALRLRGYRNPTLREVRNVCLVGTMLIAGGTGLLCVSEKYVSSSLAAIEVASVPLLACLAAFLFAQKPRAKEVAGLAIGFVGIVLLNADGNLAGSALGVVAVLAACAFWAVGSVTSQHIDMPEPMMAAALQMVAGSIAVIALAFVVGERWPVEVSTTSLGALLYCAVIGSLLAYSAYVYLLQNVRPALATSYAYINPPVALALGYFLAGDLVSWREIIAMVLILIGVAVIALDRRDKAT